MQFENSTLLDGLLPDPRYCEQHFLDLHCDRQVAYEVVRSLDFSQSKITRSLFHIRGLHLDELTLDAMTSNGSFRVLDEAPPQEFVIGHLSDRMKPVVVATSEEFRNIQLVNGLKIAWNFRTEALEQDLTRVHTETRITCHGTSATRLFKPYWLIVRPFSGLVRKEMLKAAAAKAEREPVS